MPQTATGLIELEILVNAAVGRDGCGKTNLAFAVLSIANGVMNATPKPRHAFGILIRLVVLATTSCVTTVN